MQALYTTYAQRSLYALCTLIKKMEREVEVYLVGLDHLPKHPFVVDVGANTGAFSRAMRLIRPDAILRLFEPSPKLCHWLRREFDSVCCALVSDHVQNATNFNFYKRAPQMSSTRDIHQMDVSMERCEGIARRILPNENRSVQRQRAEDICHWFNFSVVQGRQRMLVPQTTLAQSLPLGPSQRIDFLKIDAEGMEVSILKGMSAAQLSVTDVVHMEVDSERVAEATSLLYKHGMAVARSDVPEALSPTEVLHARRILGRPFTPLPTEWTMASKTHVGTLRDPGWRGLLEGVRHELRSHRTYTPSGESGWVRPVRPRVYAHPHLLVSRDDVASFSGASRIHGSQYAALWLRYILHTVLPRFGEPRLRLQCLVFHMYDSQTSFDALFETKAFHADNDLFTLNFEDSIGMHMLHHHNGSLTIRPIEHHTDDILVFAGGLSADPLLHTGSSCNGSSRTSATAFFTRSDYTGQAIESKSARARVEQEKALALLLASYSKSSRSATKSAFHRVLDVWNRTRRARPR
jgi:FkbM family methyltransferase